MKHALYFVTLIWSGLVTAQPESAYTKQWCHAHNGRQEVTLQDGTRADCLTEKHAVEVERAHKWYQSVGQALWYAFQTNKKAGIVLIIGEGDRTYLHRLESVARHNSLPIKIWTVAK